MPSEAASPIPPPSQRRGRKKRWLWLVGTLLILSLAGWLARGVFFNTLRAYLIGRTYIAAEDCGRKLPAVDEVEVLALGGEVAAGTPDSFFEDLGGHVGTVGRRTLRGEEAEKVASIWRNIPFDRHFAAMCFSPYYALRFRHQGKLILETSVCWHCSTYQLPVGVFGYTEYGFDSKSAAAQELLAALTGYVPHPAAAK